MNTPEEAGAKTDASSRAALEKRPPREPYSQPQLRVFGDIRSLTFGGSIGSLDSANPGIQKP